MNHVEVLSIVKYSEVDTELELWLNSNTCVYVCSIV